MRLPLPYWVTNPEECFHAVNALRRKQEYEAYKEAINKKRTLARAEARLASTPFVYRWDEEVHLSLSELRTTENNLGNGCRWVHWEANEDND